MSNETKLSPEEEHVLDVIYKLEESKINLGSYEFFPDSMIIQNSQIQTREKLYDILNTLQKKRLIILIKNEDGEFDENSEIKFLVRSRIAHIIWCLQNSKNMKDLDNEDWEENVVDLKYIKFDKQISKRNQDLNKIFSESYFQKNFDINAEAGLLQGVIERFHDEYDVSDFQLRSINEILNGLSKKGQNTEPYGLSIVASTGAGKSLAYQIPLIIWIIDKKIKKYKKFQNVSEAAKYTNCSAILLFPRNALAKDQFDNFNEIIEIANSTIDSWTGIDLEKKEFFKVKLRKDFGGTEYEERLKIFKELETDIIITNTETLKRRLYDPLAHNIFKYGIDLVLYDEVHLYEGLQGSYVAGLNARLNNLISYSYRGDYKGLPPLFVGMSATIDKPDKHCQKLFSLKNKPTVITDENDEKEKRSTEHHIILKPRRGRVPLGVAIDAASCLIHNRRDGLQQWHRSQVDDESRPKVITFIDSLDGTARFTYYLNELEWYDLDRNIPALWPVKRRYPAYFKPMQREVDPSVCDECTRGNDVQVIPCRAYQRGNCWYFSSDDGNRGFWIQKLGGRYNYPRDNIRSKRVTSQEVNSQKDSDSNYVFFNEYERGLDFRNRLTLNEKIDNLIATPVLEVGIDFKGISEIILYGNIRSPASYKQKAGRGAREGNLEDGLCVLSVIYNTPLSNFYFRHFERLVRPYQSPIKLEVRNPDIVASQCFAAVFDFFAANGIELYKVRESDQEEEETKRIELEYNKAKELIKKDDVMKYLESFLSNLDYSSRDSLLIKTVIERISELLDRLNAIIKVGEKEKTLIDFLSLAPRDPKIQRQLEEQFKTEFDELNTIKINIKNKKDQLIRKISEFKTFIESKCPENKELLKTISELEREFS